MRISRLLQRAGAIGAASVALFVALTGVVRANTAAQVNVYGVDGVRNADGHFEARYHFQRRFAANDPNFPGKVDYVTRKIKVEKRGNPLKWVKRSPLEVATITAVAAAGWAIDELTSQVTRPVQVPEPAPTDYYQCYSYIGSCNGANYGRTFDEVCDAWQATVPTDPSNYVRDPSTGLCARKFSGVDAYAGAVRINPKACEPGTTVSACQPSSELITVPESVPDADVWDVVNPIADDAPAHWLDPWVKDPAGNPYIYPEVRDAQADIASGVPGAEPLPDAVVVTDPLAGQGLDPSGVPTGEPIPTPQVSVSQAPLNLPNDYAREETLRAQKDAVVELRDWLKEEFNTEPDISESSPADRIYDPLTEQFDTLPDLPAGVPNVGDFGIRSGSCQTITFSWMGHSVVFPDSSQCAKLKTAQEMLGWFIYVCTFFGCVYTILGARALKA